MPDEYTYLGLTTLGYMDYADLATGKTLVAEPGGSYAIRPVEPGSPVPPGDGRWAAPASGPPPRTAPPAPPPVPEVPQPADSADPEE